LADNEAVFFFHCIGAVRILVFKFYHPKQTKFMPADFAVKNGQFFWEWA